jgi:hypothetical protein
VACIVIPTVVNLQSSSLSSSIPSNSTFTGRALLNPARQWQTQPETKLQRLPQACRPGGTRPVVPSLMLSTLCLGRRGLIFFLPTFRPFGMLLRNQTFKTFCKNTVPVVGAVGAGSGEVKILFVLEGFRGGAVQHPVGLPLVQLLGALGDDNEGGECRGDRGGDLEGGEDRHRSADDELAELDPLVRLLGGDALAAVPAKLIFQSVPRRTAPAVLDWSPLAARVVSRNSHGGRVSRRGGTATFDVNRVPGR